MIMETKDFMGQTMLSILEKARKMPASSMTFVENASKESATT